MSFELTLGSALDEAGFEALFARRPNYSVEDGQAAYQNEDTGVYFLLDHADGAVRFSINTRRSEIFAEEAAEELAALFPDFAAEAFLADWRAANREAIAAMLAEGTEPFTLPLRTHREVWRWNRDLAYYQDGLSGVDYAPPLILLEGPDGHPRPTYIWLVTRQTVKPPPAEAVLLADDPPPRLRDKLLGGKPEPVTIGVIQIRWLRDLGFPVWRALEGHLMFHVAPGKRNPSILATMASAHAYAKPAGARIKVDQVLDRETVEAVREAL